MTIEQLEAKLTKLNEQRHKIAEEAQEINDEIDRFHNSLAVIDMAPALKRQVLEAAGVDSAEAFGRLGV